MEWNSIDTWIVVIGALAAVACALLGNFLILRKMSMMVDAISHAVLPGLAIAFLVIKICVHLHVRTWLLLEHSDSCLITLEPI